MNSSAPITPMDVVIFGLDPMSELASYLLTHDSPHRPVAFTVHERFISKPALGGLPVLRFEDIERVCPPDRCAMLAPLGWRRMGEMRADVVRAGKAKGYRFISYVASRALTWPDFNAGENSMVHDGAMVQPFAHLGDNCKIAPSVVLSHHVRVGDHCFVATGATVGGRAEIGSNCVLGMNSTIVSSVRVAPRCFIAAGAVVTADTQPDGIYRGNPARRSRATLDRFPVLAS